MSGTDGTFVVAALRDDTYIITIRRLGFQPLVASPQVPVGAGFVVLLDADGAEITRTLTSRNGRFTFTLAPNQRGPLSLRSERIGYRVAVTEPFDVPADGPVDLTVWVRAFPTPLSAIEVRESTECKVRPDGCLASIG